MIYDISAIHIFTSQNLFDLMKKPLELFWKLPASDEIWGLSLGKLKGNDVLVAGSKDGNIYVWGKEGYLIWRPRKLSTSVLDVAVGKLGTHDTVAVSTKSSRDNYESDLFVWDEDGKLLWKFTKEYTVPTREA